LQGLKIRLKLALEATTEIDKLKSSLEEAKAEREKIIKTKEMAAVLKTDFQQRNAESETAKRAETLSAQYDSKIATLDAEIAKLENTLGKDYGPFHEFYTVRDECFSVKANQYEYKMCPFSKAEQLESGRSTSLGQWKGFRDGYKEMVFDEGLRCYKGPARSMTLVLECGERNEVVDVEEPEMCVYRAKLRTPLVCTPERFEELLKSAQFS
jgi:protein kinase C substrate 80K-H